MTAHEDDDRTDDVDGDDGRVVLRLETRECERRLPKLGLTRFRAISAAADAELEQAYGEDADPRAVASALIAAAIVEPSVTAEEVDGWSERTRAIARVAAAEVVGCRRAYDRRAGSGLDGDARLLEAMRERRAEIYESLRVQHAAMDAALRNVFASTSSIAKLANANVIDMTLRRQRQMEQWLRPSYFEQLERLHKHVDQVLRPSYIGRGLAAQEAAKNALAPFGSIDKLLGTKASLAAMSALPKNTLASAATETVGSALANARALRLSQTVDSVLGIGKIAGLPRAGQPSYFGALKASRLVQPPSIHRLVEQTTPTLQSSHLFGVGRIAEQFRDLGLGRLRTRIAEIAGRYQAWVEDQWLEEQGRPTPRPLLFLLISLPAMLGHRLLRELEQDDERLLDRLEEELQTGLAVELQAAVQRDVILDAVAKRHLVQALLWVADARYVDATPPLYDGLERALRLVARERKIIDADNNFLVAARGSKAKKIEDVFEHLNVDRYYVRFLNARVFGEIGNRARHCDLPEAEHRRCVLRTVLAVAGWLEFLGGQQATVANLVVRLELERGDDAAAS